MFWKKKEKGTDIVHCPVCGDKSAGFSAVKRFWHCFNCGCGGAIMIPRSKRGLVDGQAT